MSQLITTPNITDPDEFYASLIAQFETMDDAAAQAFNARLVLILANHIGDRDILQAAFDLALKSAPQSRSTPS